MSIFTCKSFDERRDRRLIAIVAIVFSVYAAFSCSYFTAAAGSVRNDVVRLHILANSNSSEDQRVKLEVRDALLKTNASVLEKGVTVGNAPEYFESSKELLINTAEEVLKKNGLSYGAQIKLQREYYETRSYGSLTFPAGEYLSLKVVLGEGAGRNWWCVMFPPLCVPAAGRVEAKEEKTADYLSPSGDRIVNSGDKYIIGFKLLELFEGLKEEIR